MKKFLLITCAAALMGVGVIGCTKTAKECEQTEQDTVVVNDTVVVEEFDTVYAE